MPRLPNEEITLTLRSDQAVLVCAALKVFGTMAAGRPEDPDTAATAEVFELYLSTMNQLFSGDGGWHSSYADSGIDELAKQLERDMLTIIHRNYRYTAKGLEKR